MESGGCVLPLRSGVKCNLIDVGDQLPFRRVPVLLLGSSELCLDVEQLNLNVATLSIPTQVSLLMCGK